MHLKRPTQIHMRAHDKDFYLALLRVGFTIAIAVTSNTVRFYRTISPLLSNS